MSILYLRGSYIRCHILLTCPKYIALNWNSQSEITRQSGFSRTISADRMGNRGTDPLEKDDGGGRFFKHGSPVIYHLGGGGITWFLREQKGGWVVTENPKEGITENFGRI